MNSTVLDGNGQVADFKDSVGLPATVQLSAAGSIPMIPEANSVMRSTAGYLAPGQSDVSVSGYVATNLSGGAKSVPLRTVTVGKKFLITDLHLSTDQAKTSGYFHVQILKNAVSVFDTIIHDLTPLTDTLETQIAGVAGPSL